VNFCLAQLMNILKVNNMKVYHPKDLTSLNYKFEDAKTSGELLHVNFPY
jgi:hypothetical protein